MATASLQTTLAPLLLFLNSKHIQEIMINRPNEIWTDDGKNMKKQSTDMSLKMLKRLAELIAAQSGQEISAQKPLLSTLLPGGHRVQIIMSPATKIFDAEKNWQDAVCLSIRKHSMTDFNLALFSSQGGFAKVSVDQNNSDQILRDLSQDKKYLELLSLAVKMKKTILISGGTYSGKTTLLNMLINEIDPKERVISIEDTPELCIKNENQVRLFYSRGMQGVDKIGAYDLLNASLRMRADRIIMGELRDDDAACWLQAANTGHEGTLSTIHSDSPLLAIQKLCDMVRIKTPLQADESIKQYIYSVLDIIIQVKRDCCTGKRFISDIFLTH